jgi:Trypsin
MSRYIRIVGRGLILASLTALVIGGSATGQAQRESVEALIAYPTVSEVIFESVAESATTQGTASTFVANPFKTFEKPAELGEWPASFFYKWPIGGGRSDMCSATLIGPQTFVTAAHCLPPGVPISVKLGGNVIRTIGCIQADGFKVPTSENDIDRCQHGEACPASRDVALCLLDDTPMVAMLETMASAVDTLKLNQPVMLTGFGCTKRDGAGGTPAGKIVFSIGWASLSRLPAPEKNNNYVLTSAVLPIEPLPPEGPKAAGSDLCPGDSGGGAYLSGLNIDNRAWRRLMGVNSAARRSPDGRLVVGPSFIVPLSSVSARELISGWADKALLTMKNWPKDRVASADTSICGLRAEQNPRCRP